MDTEVHANRIDINEKHTVFGKYTGKGWDHGPD